MTPLEEQLRGTFRDRASDVTQAHIRLDYPVAGPNIATLQRRGWRTTLPVLVAAAILAVILVGVVVASTIGSERATPPVSSPAPSMSAPPPVDPGAPYQLWLSETVIPAAGVDIVAALVRSGGRGAAMFGVGVMVDRWDGSEWQPYRYAATCPELCVGTLERADAEESGPGIAYVMGADGVGFVVSVKLTGLEPGSYRLRKTFETMDVSPPTVDAATSPIEAIGQFTVVHGDAPIVPLGNPDDTQLLIYQPLLPPTGGSLPFLRRGGPPVDTWMPAQVDVERWTGDRWEPSTTLAVSASPGDLRTAQVEIPPSEAGAYRIVDRSTPTEHQAVFWVSDTVPH